MKVDEESSLSDEHKAYQSYVDEIIMDTSLCCDSIIETILYYKYILSLEYDINTVSTKVSDVLNKLDKIEKDSKIIENILKYIYSEKIDISLSDFKELELSGELLRDYKIYNLINKIEQNK